MDTPARDFWKFSATTLKRLTATVGEAAAAFDRALKSPEAAAIKVRAIRTYAATDRLVARSMQVFEAVVLRENGMRVISVIMAVFIIAIALLAII